MTKKLLKILTILTVITTGLFVNINEVKATTPNESWCTYYSPLAFIDDSGRATNVVLKIPYYNWDSLTGLVWDSRSSTVTMKAFCLNYNDSEYFVGFSTINSIEYPAVDGYSNPQNTFFFSYYYDINSTDYYEIDSSAVSGSKYVELVKVKDNKYKLLPSNKTTYQTFLKSQYKPLSTEASKYNLYNLIAINFTGSKTDISGDVAVKGTDYISDVQDGNNTFKKFLNQSERDNVGVVFATNKEKYPSKQLGTFKKMMSSAEKEDGSKLTQEEQTEALNGLSVAIDTGEYDRAVTVEYYNTTKDLWYEYMKDDLKNPKKAEGTRKTYFKYWFDLVGRRVFEESDTTKFLEYWDYICETKTYDLCGGKDNCEQKTVCENVKTIVNNKKTYTNATTNISTLENNKCLAACKSCLKDTASYNATACDACKNSTSSTSNYKKCRTCMTTTVSTNCANVGSQYTDSCEDSELKKCLGEDAYNEIKNNYDTTMSQYKSAQQNAANNAADAAIEMYDFYKTPTPELDFGFEKYEVQCDDVVIFHNVYTILVILAPVIALTLSTVDYFRAVLAGDEKKMQEQKKKMPKRIIMLVCLILAPILVRIILAFSDKLDNSLLDCIVNGS